MIMIMNRSGYWSDLFLFRSLSEKSGVLVARIWNMAQVMEGSAAEAMVLADGVVSWQVAGECFSDNE